VDGKTQVTIHMIFPTAAARNKVVEEFGAIQGGNQTLARLADYVNKSESQDHQGEDHA